MFALSANLWHNIHSRECLAQHQRVAWRSGSAGALQAQGRGFKSLRDHQKYSQVIAYFRGGGLFSFSGFLRAESANQPRMAQDSSCGFLLTSRIHRCANHAPTAPSAAAARRCSRCLLVRQMIDWGHGARHTFPQCLRLSAVRGRLADGSRAVCRRWPDGSGAVPGRLQTGHSRDRLTVMRGHNAQCFLRTRDGMAHEEDNVGRPGLRAVLLIMRRAVHGRGARGGR